MILKRKAYIRGFTLIELLVVMAVMSVLIGIGVNTFTIAQKKARDSKRKADLRTIQVAMEAYKINNNGQYPLPNGCSAGQNCYGMSNNTCTRASALGPCTYTASNGWIVGLEPDYIRKLPVDPINNASNPWGPPNSTTSNNYTYAYGNISADYSNYDLVANLEDAGDPDTCEKKDYQFNLTVGGGSWCRYPSGHANAGSLGRYASTLYVVHAPQ